MKRLLRAPLNFEPIPHCFARKFAIQDFHEATALASKEFIE
ncbi:hypothetical protein [Azospirillum doebereinerae]